MNEPRPGLTGPKVSFASQSRWGTEPEGWYVDLPYAVFMVGVNYSPLGCHKLKRGNKFESMQNQQELVDWLDAEMIGVPKNHRGSNEGATP